jgi:hypothetical protein
VLHENQYRVGGDLEGAYEAMGSITRSGDWYLVLGRYFSQGGLMEQREGGYQQMVGQRGFDPDLSALWVQQLNQQGIRAHSLGDLIEQVFALGYRGVQFHQGHVWIEKESQAFRGEGKPAEALVGALLEGQQG